APPHGRVRRGGAGGRGARDRGRTAHQRDDQERRGGGGAARCRDVAGATALRGSVVGRRASRHSDRKMIAAPWTPRRRYASPVAVSVRVRERRTGAARQDLVVQLLE